MTLEEPHWPPRTIDEQFAFWRQRERRYVLRKRQVIAEEQAAIRVAREQDIREFPHPGDWDQLRELMEQYVP